MAVITAFATFKKPYKDMKKFIIGIDFSKETVDASIVQKEQPETLIAYKKFRNNLKGVDGLIAWAKSKVAQDGEIIFCGENTGTYSTLSLQPPLELAF